MATQEQIQQLADLKYLAQNTGVATATLNAAYDAVGIDSSDPFAYMQASELLQANGYNPGNNENFYGNNSPQDVSAQILYDRWQNVPTDEDLIAAGLDPNDYVVVNNNVANQRTYNNNSNLWVVLIMCKQMQVFKILMRVKLLNKIV